MMRKPRFLVPLHHIHNPLKVHRRMLRGGKFDFKTLGRYVLYGFVGIVLFLALLFAWFAKDLPTPGKIKQLHASESTQILDRKGNLLFAVAGEKNRIVVDKKDIPKVMKDATVAIEDKDFYKHFGVDFRGVARAVIYNLLHRRIGQGGSTITQQYVKNALLSPKRSFARKIKEIILSLEIEALYSKDDILALYLNEIPYGSNAYGVQAAAQTFFGKDSKDLTLAEATTLAALPQAPTYYSLYGSHPKERIARTQKVLDRMVEQKYISKDDAEKAKKEVGELKFQERHEFIQAPHFVMYVRELLIDKYGEREVEEGGLRVTTTLDPDAQKITEEAVKEGAAKNLKRFGATNAASTVIDPKTGQILAMVGSVDFFNKENDGQVNVNLTEQQPGSALKPVVYATAFKGKYNPAFTLFDLRTDFNGYSPEDFDGSTRGPVSIRRALGNSLNIPAVKTLGLVGLDNAIDTAHEMGITSLQDRKRYGLSLVLGGGDVRPLDLTTVYSALGNSGVLAPTTPILKVEDQSGKVLEEFRDQKKKVLDPQVAYLVDDILKDNDARKEIFGPRSALYFPDFEIAAKTGTSQDFRDAWAMATTPNLTVGVWVGNNDNSPMAGVAAAANSAAPIMHQIVADYLKDKPKESFSRPPGIQEVTVDSLSNKLPTQYSPETRTDLFASWQVPTERDDVHVIYRVCKSNGFLADSSVSDDFVEDRLFTDIHSERPDDPAWEGPVRAWASANGINNIPPREKCDLYSEQNRPQVKLLSPVAGQTISGTFTIRADASAPNGLDHVEFQVDGTKVGEDSTSPYEIQQSTSGLSLGNHTITAIAFDKNGFTNKTSSTVNVAKDTIAPGPVANATVSTGSNQLTIGWVSPTDPDLASVRVYLSSSAGSLGSLQQDLPIGSGKTGTATLAGLTSGTTYYITLRPVDTAGNENQSTTQYSGKPN